MTYAEHYFFLIDLYQLNDHLQSFTAVRVRIFCPYLGFGQYINAIFASKIVYLQDFADMSCFVGFARINITGLDFGIDGRVLKFGSVTVRYFLGLYNVNVRYRNCLAEIDSGFVHSLNVNFSYVRFNFHLPFI